MSLIRVPFRRRRSIREGKGGGPDRKTVSRKHDTSIPPPTTAAAAAAAARLRGPDPHAAATGRPQRGRWGDRAAAIAGAAAGIHARIGHPAIRPRGYATATIYAMVSLADRIIINTNPVPGNRFTRVQFHYLTLTRRGGLRPPSAAGPPLRRGGPAAGCSKAPSRAVAAKRPRGMGGLRGVLSLAHRIGSATTAAGRGRTTSTASLPRGCARGRRSALFPRTPFCTGTSCPWW